MDALAVMPKYDVYKDSGVSWLGIVPEKWKVIPAKRRHRVFKSINKRNQCDNVLSLTLRGVVNNNLENPEGLIPRDYASYQVFEKDDLVFKLIDLENLKTSRVGIVHERGIMSPAYIRMSVNANHCPKYAYYYFYDLYLNAVYNNLGEGVRSTLGPNDLLQIVVVEPSFDEQVAIANFLDRKLVQVDEAISIKEKQILLLKERKQIIIQKAVTQGLNPDVPMKDSGVDWIGQIPEHWTVSKIGHYARVYNGSTPSRDVSRYWENGTIPWMSSGKVNDYKITTPSELVSEAAIRECSLRLFPKGTVLVGIVGQGKTRGTSAILEIDAVINQNVAGIIPSNKLSSLFLHQYLIQAYEEVRNQGQGSNQEALNCQILSAFKIAFPPLNEQKAIVEFISDQSNTIDQTIEIQQSQIYKLKEYKSTLINSAVTGKIKVV